MVERSHVFNLLRALKDRSGSQELAGDIKSILCSFQLQETCTLHLVPFHGIPSGAQLRLISCGDEHALAIVFQGHSHGVLDSL